MFQLRLVIALFVAAALLPAKLVAQFNSNDSGQYVILSAQYGTSRRHVDVTERLKQLARQDRTFRMGNSSFGVDPDPGKDKTLRIYARGPNGQERMFEYREGSMVDGSQFRSWGGGDWGNGGWSGNWEGGGYGRGDDRDSGQNVILSAQYGTARRHVDVTNRLKELARQDRNFRMGNSSFGVDPDPGQDKTLRIYARGRDGQERMFEYREGSMVDGSQFRSWGGGDWGNGGWSGDWEGGRGRGNYERQPEMTAAIQNLREAQRNLQLASHDKGGHRENAIRMIDQAIGEVEMGIQYDNTH
jgi:hypothetical protein